MGVATMGLSVRAVFRSGLVAFGLSLLLLALLAVMANGLGAAGVSVRTVQVVSLGLGILARLYAGLIGGRMARREGLEVGGIVLSAALGCAIGFVVLQLLNSFTEVALLGRQLTLAWSMLYGVLPWVAEGAAGGLLAARARPRRRRRMR